jgi:hypothetical protein
MKGRRGEVERGRGVLLMAEFKVQSSRSMFKTLQTLWTFDFTDFMDFRTVFI